MAQAVCDVVYKIETVVPLMRQLQEYHRGTDPERSRTMFERVCGVRTYLQQNAYDYTAKLSEKILKGIVSVLRDNVEHIYASEIFEELSGFISLLHYVYVVTSGLRKSYGDFLPLLLELIGRTESLEVSSLAKGKVEDAVDYLCSSLKVGGYSRRIIIVLSEIILIRGLSDEATRIILETLGVVLEDLWFLRFMDNVKVRATDDRLREISTVAWIMADRDGNPDMIRLRSSGY